MRIDAVKFEKSAIKSKKNTSLSCQTWKRSVKTPPLRALVGCCLRSRGFGLITVDARELDSRAEPKPLVNTRVGAPKRRTV